MAIYMKSVRIIFIMVAVLVLLFLIASLFLAAFTMTGKRQTLEEAMQWQSERYDTSFYHTLDKTRYTVAMEDGYLLHAEFLKNPETSNKYIILSHGYTDSRMGSLKYVRMYLDLGFNCVLYDLRGHGENEPTFTTYGIREGKDLSRLIDDTRARYPGLHILGLHGESLGAASTVSALRYRPQVDFAVADCGFSDIENVLRGGYRKAKLPAALFDVANTGAKLRYHYALKDMRPIDALSENEVPVLFIHGEDDPFILPKNSQDMYGRTQGYKEIRLIAGAGHAESVLVDPAEYRQTVEGFLTAISK